MSSSMKEVKEALREVEASGPGAGGRKGGGGGTTMVRKKQDWPARVEKAKFDAWLQNMHKWPAPEGALGNQRNVDIFWDMDNVPLYPVNNVPGLYPHDQYDILLRRMGYDLGAASVRMYVAIAQDRLDSYLPAVKRRITAVHPNVTIQPVQGRTRGGKREISDNVLKSSIKSFVDRGQRGNAIVIVSGDGDFVPEVRCALHKGVNVYLLTPSRVVTSDELFKSVHWQQYFNRFIELHTGRVKPEQKRETPKKKTNKKKKTPAEKLAEAARKGKKLEMDEYKAHIIEEREHTQLDILIMIDGTKSMELYIESIKEAIGSDLTVEIQTRYRTAAGNVRYGVLVYRDIGDEKQYEMLDFTPDPGAVVDFLATVIAKGGSDYTEDVIGAMLKAAEMGWAQKNKAVFHVLEAPAHGHMMHDLGEANDNFFHRPPEGRDLPDVEARRAMAKLQELGVQRYVFCHLEKQHCTKMTELLREILREDGKDKTAEESSWLVDTEVTRDPAPPPGLEPVPSKTRLASLVGKLIGQTMGTISASMSRATLTRKQPERSVGQKTYDIDDELSTVPEDVGEAGGAASEASTEPEQEPVKLMLDEWCMEGAERRAWEATLGKYRDVFKKMRRKKGPTQVKIILPPNYHGDMDRLLEDIDDQGLSQGTDPSDSFREYLIREAPPQGFEGENKVAFLAQEQIKGYRTVTRKAADGSTVEHAEKSDFPIVVLKEYKTFGRGEHSFDRYNKELQACGVAALLAQLFNERVKEVKDRLTVAPKTLSYLETGLVSYQGFPAGKTKQGPSKQPVQIYRLQEPLVLGKFIKWSSNAGYVNMEEWDEIAHAFTHWTYQATEGRLMVTDVQGVRVGKAAIKLTDPQIHCVHPELFTHETSSFGRVGMLKFFQNHQCGDTCKALGLSDALEELERLRGELDGLQEEDVVEVTEQQGV